jgi:hypothetical protein
MGTYAESLLTPDEKVITRERQHWLALILDSWLAIIFWGATAILLVVGPPAPRHLRLTSARGRGQRGAPSRSA